LFSSGAVFLPHSAQQPVGRVQGLVAASWASFFVVGRERFLSVVATGGAQSYYGARRDEMCFSSAFHALVRWKTMPAAPLICS
jgi:hypothetical protein